MSTEDDFLDAYKIIKDVNRKVVSKVHETIKLEQTNRPLDALAAYEENMQHIEEIFALPVSLPESILEVEEAWRDCINCIQGLKACQTFMIYRLKVLRSTHFPPVKSEESSDSETDEPLPKRKCLLWENPSMSCGNINDASAIHNEFNKLMKIVKEVVANRDSNYTFNTLFQSNAKLFKIDGDGDVSTLADATSISLVVCIVDNKRTFLNAISVLQCPLPETKPDTEQSKLIWIYPLIPKLTKWYHTDYGAFLFPDLESNNRGDMFGIMIGDRIPSFASQIFEQNLEGIISVCVKELKLPSDASEDADNTHSEEERIANSASLTLNRYLATQIPACVQSLLQRRFGNNNKVRKVFTLKMGPVEGAPRMYNEVEMSDTVIPAGLLRIDMRTLPVPDIE